MQCKVDSLKIYIEDVVHRSSRVQLDLIFKKTHQIRLNDETKDDSYVLSTLDAQHERTKEHTSCRKRLCT